MTDPTRPRGRYFEEFEIGDSVESPGRTITETDVVLFAGLSGDYNQLHTDAEFAQETLFGERIAHGLLGLAIASGLSTRMGFVEGTAQAFTGLDWKFRGPIKIGDTIRVRAQVRQKKEMARLGGGFVVFDVAILNQRDETVQKGTWTVLVRSASGSDS
ncbi:MAG TPA: dehydratase [Chloroflexi bacterium]|nr:dehydratase [Chloroflexota bacterium]